VVLLSLLLLLLLTVVVFLPLLLVMGRGRLIVFCLRHCITLLLLLLMMRLRLLRVVLQLLMLLLLPRIKPLLRDLLLSALAFPDCRVPAFNAAYLYVGNSWIWEKALIDCLILLSKCLPKRACFVGCRVSEVLDGAMPRLGGGSDPAQPALRHPRRVLCRHPSDLQQIALLQLL
jgi:hypothetical protein